MAMNVPGNVLADYPDLFALILILLLTGESALTNAPALLSPICFKYKC